MSVFVDVCAARFSLLLLGGAGPRSFFCDIFEVEVVGSLVCVCVSALGAFLFLFRLICCCFRTSCQLSVSFRVNL